VLPLLESAVRAHNQQGTLGVTIDGRTYQNIRSKLSGMLPGASGTDKQAIGEMIGALDGMAERSLLAASHTSAMMGPEVWEACDEAIIN
jgi:hypothetical protein